MQMEQGLASKTPLLPMLARNKLEVAWFMALSIVYPSACEGFTYSENIRQLLADCSQRHRMRKERLGV